MTLENFSPSNEWITDTEASAHMTGNLDMLETPHCYVGTNAIIIRNGSFHAITHVGDTYINNGTTKIKLRDMLLVSALVKNRLSIGQLTTDYP